MTAGEQAEFGAVLRRFREQRGLSQEALAERAGLSSHAVSALERGIRTRPYPHTVRALAGALDLEPDSLASLVAAVPARAGSAPTGSDDRPRAARGLAVPPTPLLGRDDDVARVGALLADHRLVTLTGTGGVGKTRLAVAVAEAVRDRYADGVWSVELASVRDPAAVLPAVLDTLGLEATPGDVDRVIGDWLADRQALLVLDNLEHVLEVAPRVAALVEHAPGARILATSRAPLRVSGEHEAPVEPLALPDHPGDRSPAVRLLLERAGSITAAWGTGGGEREAVSGICERLAGIPLAIELAAARARVLDPQSLLARLDEALLTGGRDRPERQRTMRATLDWSYGLLSDDQQRLLRTLSTFVGGFRLDDLEGVVRRSGPELDVLGALESLAEQSLVATESLSGGGVRHRLLEPVSQYARTRLEEAGEQERAGRAHAAHYLSVAVDYGPRYREGDQVAALDRIDDEHANLTAAIEFFLDSGDAVSAGECCWALWLYWWLRGHHSHGRRLSESALGHELPAGVRPRTELAAATMAFAMDDVPGALGHWEQAERYAGGDPVVLANSVAGLGLVALATGDLDEAADRFAVAREHAVAGGREGEWTLALSSIWAGTVALLQGDPDRAVAEIEQGLASARRRGDLLSTYIALFNLSQAELTRGRHERARDLLDEGIRLSRETSDHANLAYLLDASAVLEPQQQGHSRVPLLLGAAQAIREQLGSFGYGYYRPDPAAIAAAEAEARARLGTDRYDDALDVGRGLDPLRAAALALRERHG